MVDQEHERENQRDRAAVEHIRGRSLPTTWPAAALPPGARVWVVKDANWDGPWQTEFVGTIDTLGAPETIDHPHAEIGELAYWVTFDEPQLDSAGDGPYRKALIWGRYLRFDPAGRWSPNEQPEHLTVAAIERIAANEDARSGTGVVAARSLARWWGVGSYRGCTVLRATVPLSIAGELSMQTPR